MQELEIGIGVPERIQGPVVAVGIQSQPVIPHQAPECTHNAVGLMPIAKPKQQLRHPRFKCGFKRQLANVSPRLDKLQLVFQAI
jgi:hypothetical protein